MRELTFKGSKSTWNEIWSRAATHTRVRVSPRVSTAGTQLYRRVACTTQIWVNILALRTVSLFYCSTLRAVVLKLFCL